MDIPSDIPNEGSFPYTLTKDMDKYTVSIDTSRIEVPSKGSESEEQNRYIFFNTGHRNVIRFFYHKNKHLRNLGNKKFKLHRITENGNVILNFVFKFTRRKIIRVFNGTVPILSITPLKFREYLEKRQKKEGDIEYTTFKTLLKNTDRYSILLTFDQEKIKHIQRDPQEFGGNFFYLERLEYPEILKSQGITTLSISRFSDKEKTLEINTFLVFKYLGENEISIKDMNPKKFLLYLKKRKNPPELKKVDLHKCNVKFDYKSQDMSSEKFAFQYLEHQEKKIEIKLDEEVYENYLKTNDYFREDFKDKDYLTGISDYFYFLPYFLKEIQEAGLNELTGKTKEYYQEIKEKIGDIDLENYFVFPPLENPDFKIKHYNIEKRTEYFCDLEIIFLDDFEILFTLDHGVTLNYSGNFLLKLLRDRVKSEYKNFEKGFANKIKNGLFKTLSDYTIEKLVKHLFHLKVISNEIISDNRILEIIKYLSLFRRHKTMVSKRFNVKEPEIFTLFSLFYNIFKGVKDIHIRNTMKSYIYSHIQELSGLEKSSVNKLIMYTKGLADLFQTREIIDDIKDKLKDAFTSKERLGEIADIISDDIKDKFVSDKIYQITTKEVKRRLLGDYLIYEDLVKTKNYLESVIGHRNDLIREVKEILYDNTEVYVQITQTSEMASYLANVLYDFLNASNEMLAVTCFEVILAIIGSFSPEYSKAIEIKSPRALPQMMDVDSEGMYNLILRISNLNKKEANVYHDLINQESILLSKLRHITIKLLLKEQVGILKEQENLNLLDALLRRLEFFMAFPIMKPTLQEYSPYILEIGNIIHNPDLRSRYKRIVDNLDI